MKTFKKMSYLLVAIILVMSVVVGCDDKVSSGDKTIAGAGETTAIADGGQEKESEGSGTVAGTGDVSSTGSTGETKSDKETVTGVVPGVEVVLPPGGDTSGGGSNGDTSSGGMATDGTENATSSGDNKPQETTTTGDVKPQETTTKTPGTTAQPTTTKTPGTTAQPTTTKAPGTTAQPTTTKAPSTTAQPTTTKDTGSSNLTSTQKKAKVIVDQIIKSGMTDFDKALAIHDWLTFNVDYDFSYSIYDVDGTLDKRRAVCDGYAKTYMMMCDLAGLDCVRITGTAMNSNGKTESHAWNQVKVSGTWYNVDVTWDDPASEGKDFNNHVANRYDYFLISNSNMNKNHFADSYSTPNNCPSDYNRKTVLKAGVNNGYRKDTGFAENQAEANAVIKRCVEAGYSEFYIWYYNTSTTQATMWDEFFALTATSPYPVTPGSSYPPSDGVTKYKVVLSVPLSEWNSTPVVKNAEEFANVCNTKLANGESGFKVRYEPTDGNFSMSGLKYGISYKQTSYGSNYKLYTIYKS